MPANLMTLAHFSVSSVMSLPKSAGEPASAAPPKCPDVCRFSDAGSTDLTTRSGNRRPKSAKARLYNPASFEWSTVVQRGPLSSKSGRGLNGNRGRPSQFAAQGRVFAETPRGLRHWSATTLRSMLGNPAYIGRAVLGRSRIVAAGPRPCLLRRNSPSVPSAMRRVAGPREEWIEIAVPALIELGMFEAAQAQLAENRKRKRYSQSGPRWLLQGLTVCRCCGYAYCATTVPSPTDRLTRRHHYYRCLSMKEHGFNGVAKCGNPSVCGDRLEQAVWEQVRALLEDPSRVADEYRRCIGQANGEAGPLEQGCETGAPDSHGSAWHRSPHRLLRRGIH